MIDIIEKLKKEYAISGAREPQHSCWPSCNYFINRIDYIFGFRFSLGTKIKKLKDFAGEIIERFINNLDDENVFKSFNNGNYDHRFIDFYIESFCNKNSNICSMHVYDDRNIYKNRKSRNLESDFVKLIDMVGFLNCLIESMYPEELTSKIPLTLDSYEKALNDYIISLGKEHHEIDIYKYINDCSSIYTPDGIDSSKYPFTLHRNLCSMFLRNKSDKIPFYCILKNSFNGISEKIDIEQFMLNYYFFKETSRLHIDFRNQLVELIELPPSFIKFMYERFTNKEMIRVYKKSAIDGCDRISKSEDSGYILASSGKLCYYIDEK